MKNLKIALACILFVTLAAVGSAFSEQKAFDGSMSFTYDLDFENGDVLNSDVQNIDNWSVGEATDEVCPGSGKFCAYTATWLGTPSSLITEADLLNEIKNKYNSLFPGGFPTDPYAWIATIKGVSVTITFYQKA